MSTYALSALKDKLARTKGEIETAEQSVEDMHGLDAIMSAWARIDTQKRELRKTIYHLVAVIRLWEPDFHPATVQPIVTRHRSVPNGTISQEAFAVLRDAGRPLRTREIARRVAKRLGRDLDNRSLARLDSAISGALTPQVSRGAVMVSDGPPKLWRLQ